MKSKTIKSVLRKKIDNWLESITDEKVRYLARQNVIVTGGSIVNMLLNEKVNDYDIYFRSSEALFEVCAYYMKQFLANPPSKFKNSQKTISIYLADSKMKPVDTYAQWVDSDGNDRLRIVVKSQGVANEQGTDAYSYFEGVPDATDAGAFVDQAAQHAEESKKNTEKPSYRPVFLTSNAITLSDDIQLVVRFFGTAESIHKNFDFAHCMNYWQSWDGDLHLDTTALECILNKELRYIGSRYPLCSIFRVRKFLDRGWKINAGQLLKACLQISTINLENIHTLEEQLIGVDAAYFSQVVDLCKERMEKTGSDKVDSTYLVELIDMIF